MTTNKGPTIYLLFGLTVIIGLSVVWGLDTCYCVDASIDCNVLGLFGDFFGGVVGTLFAIIGVYFVYITFKNQIISQEKSEIESRFFELISLHSQNVQTLKALDSDVFNIYIKFIVNFNKAIGDYNVKQKKGWGQKDCVKLSYLYFFYGYENANKERLEGIEISVEEILKLNHYLLANGYSYDPTYKDLGIYFRQLYQIVDYVNGKEVLSYKEKYGYIKILRVKLNIEEQYLLFLNSFIATGRHWELDQTEKNDKLITKYNLIKNIPKDYPQIAGLNFREEYSSVFYEHDGSKKLEKRKQFEADYN